MGLLAILGCAAAVLVGNAARPQQLNAAPIALVTVGAPGESVLTDLAATEARRYLRLLLRRPVTLHQSATDLEAAHLLESLALHGHPDESDTPGGRGKRTVVVVATRQHAAVHSVLSKWNRTHYSDGIQSLRSQDAHLIHSLESNTGAAVIACVGASPIAALYSVYSLSERLGARFYLHGEVLPSSTSPPRTLPAIGVRHQYTPKFAVRGLQPFHDFPMGPDWWQPQFWKALATNMAKMKLNFYGFHTYPIKPTPGTNAEPLVWVGPTSGYNSTGHVSPDSAYDTSWYQTEDFWAAGTNHTRGNVPGQKSVATSTFCCGASQVFSRDCYGSEAQADICYPTTKTESATVLNNAADMLVQAFQWGATYAGVNAAVGVEFPLQLPPDTTISLQEAYEGMFGRTVALRLNISTFWLWTNEGVEDHGNGKGLPSNNPMWAELVAEIKVAQAAAKAVGATFNLGTSGWCLGPGDDPAFFDKEIQDPSFIVSAINGRLGWLPPDPAFAQMNGNRSWAIPWMEDDLSLNGAELWVNRTLEHAALANKYGTSGLLGLTWRTWETAPQISALATAAWSTGDPPLTDLGLYTDFCTANFGADTAAECAARFLEVDSFTSAWPTSKLPRNGQACCGGPMTAGVVKATDLLNVSGFEAWLAKVQGVEAVERATQWVNLFRYHRHAQLVSNASAYVGIAGQAPTLPPWALAQALNMSALYTEMITLLLETATSPGTLGMIAAHEGANWPSAFNASVKNLAPRNSATCTVDPTHSGCFADSNTNRTFPHTAWLSNAATTQETCAVACFQVNLPLAAVEFGVACFCGAEMPPAGLSRPVAACGQMKCRGDPAEDCGAADIMLVYSFTCVNNGTNGLSPSQIRSIAPPHTYSGHPRLVEMAPRSVVSALEPIFTVEITALSATPPTQVELHIAGHTVLPLAVVPDPITKRSVSQVYSGGLPTNQLSGDFEYWVTATFATGDALRYPTVSNRTVVVVTTT
eukprot:m.80027 g.80027  ORF g.80027 m.80027 type:complete len:983 (-) comp10865_c0_seq1:26-2974(-)